MPKVYTYSQARQNLAEVLQQAEMNGDVIIKRRNGEKFMVRAIKEPRSPLDVEGIDTDISRDEIVESVRESREDRY
jgi:PHD/YefM family antitoxin component YafN of YafNO toxin-antitoxin module